MVESKQVRKHKMDHKREWWGKNNIKLFSWGIVMPEDVPLK